MYDLLREAQVLWRIALLFALLAEFPNTCFWFVKSDGTTAQSALTGLYSDVNRHQTAVDPISPTPANAWS